MLIKLKKVINKLKEVFKIEDLLDKLTKNNY